MMEAVFKQIKRDGELRGVVRIQFEGAQVGLLQDQISKQETFQVMRGWMEIQTENTHIVPRWEKERNCWCLSTLWVAGEEQLKYGNRYQLGRKKFWIFSINRSYLYSITSLWTGGRYIGRSWNFMRGGYHYPCWPCKVFYFSSPFFCNSVCASKNQKSLFFTTNLCCSP